MGTLARGAVRVWQLFGSCGSCVGLLVILLLELGGQLLDDVVGVADFLAIQLDKG